MIPPGVDPRKMDQLMRQMGIRQEEICSSRVVIEKEDGAIIIDNPSVIKITMQGNSSFQVSGDIRTVATISNDDVKMVAEQACVSEEKASEALKAADGDIAKAILSLQSGKENK
jgi:nascent polypeptide-associated complex subunit alpha